MEEILLRRVGEILRVQFHPTRNRSNLFLPAAKSFIPPLLALRSIFNVLRVPLPLARGDCRPVLCAASGRRGRRRRRGRLMLTTYFAGLRLASHVAHEPRRPTATRAVAEAATEPTRRASTLHSDSAA